MFATQATLTVRGELSSPVKAYSTFPPSPEGSTR
jgi:hypothetical protein